MSFKFDSYVSGYNIEKHGVVSSLYLNFSKEEVPADIVVLCNGPQARSHLRKHFETVLPMISAQGYSFDLPDHDAALHADLHLKLADRGYAYAQLSPGKHRIVSLMDFGLHEEAFLDKERVAHVLGNYRKDFKIDPSETESFKNMRSCLRP